VLVASQIVFKSPHLSRHRRKFTGHQQP